MKNGVFRRIWAKEPSYSETILGEKSYVNCSARLSKRRKNHNYTNFDEFGLRNLPRHSDLDLGK